MIEANRASSSAKLVSMSTAVWGRAARMSRGGSIPEPSERRTSITITSGRAWAATATASRAELASAQTTTSSVSCSRSLMPSRTTSWSSTSMTRSGGALMGLSSQDPLGGLKRVGVAGSGRMCLDASFVTDSPDVSVGHGLIRDCRADPVEEVLHGRLRHPVEQHPVHSAADHAERWAVAGADSQLGPISAERAQLEVGVQAGEHPLQADRLPGQRERGHGRKAHRLAQLDPDLAP